MLKFLLIGANSNMAIEFARFATESGHVVEGVSQNKCRNQYLASFYSSEDFLFSDKMHTLIKDKIIIYFAWRSPKRTNDGQESYSDKLSIFDLQNYLEKIDSSEIKKMIFISSAGAIYGSIKEEQNELSNLNPITAYGIEKLRAERLLFRAINQKKLLICRVTNPYGFRSPPQNGIGFIDHALQSALNNGIINVFGSGKIERDFIHIDDFSRAIFSLENNNQYGIFNICSGKPKKIIDLAVFMSRSVLGSRIEFTKVEDPKIKFCRINNEKLLRIINFEMEDVEAYLIRKINEKQI